MTKGTVCQTGSRLNADTAKGLAVSSSVISLSYNSISSAAARVMADFQGKRIDFDEFPRMDEQSARSFLRLAEAGKVSIAWLRARRLIGHIERSTVLALARYADSVDLDGLPDLTASEANVLATFKGVQILLYLDRLDKKTAVNLAKASPELLHVSVKRATDAALIALAASNATDELQIRLESGSLSARAAADLARFRGHTLWLVLRKSPTVSVMREIAQFNNHLSIHIPIVTPDIAKTLADSDGTLDLDYDKSSSPVVETILSNSNREITNIDGLLD